MTQPDIAKQVPDQTPDLARYRSIADLIAQHAADRGDKAFLQFVEDGRSVTYGEMEAHARRIGRWLTANGYGVGDRIAVLSDNCPEQLILYFALLRNGVTYCTINTDVNTAHVAEMLGRIEARLVIAAPGLDQDAMTDGLEIGWLDIAAAFDAFAACDDGPDTPPDVPPDTLAVISFTSGTSSAPKGVMHEHGNYFWIAEQTIDMWGIAESDRVLEYRSFSWASSHMLTLTPCLVQGATILFAPHFSQSRFFDWIHKFRPTVVIGVPTVVNMLLERTNDVSDDTLQDAFDGVRFMSCSTAPLMVEQHERFERAFGIKLIQIYGMSEGGVVAGNHWDNRRIGSVGPPGLYQNLRIVDPEGAKLPDGEIGEIELGGAQTGRGYIHADGEIERLRGTRLKTGDLGYLDPDGFLHVTGRAKDVIIRGGVNISPLEIDNALVRHPDVAEAATIGVPDKVYGEEAIAFVAARPGSALSADDVAAHCVAALPDFKRPKQIVMLDDIPKNARGKIDRAALRDRWDSTAN